MVGSRYTSLWLIRRVPTDIRVVTEDVIRNRTCSPRSSAPDQGVNRQAAAPVPAAAPASAGAEKKRRPSAPTYIYLVKNQKTSETYLCGSDQKIAQGEFVVSPTRYGLDMGKVLGMVRSKLLSTTVKELEAEAAVVPFIDQASPCTTCGGCEGEGETPAESPAAAEDAAAAEDTAEAEAPAGVTGEQSEAASETAEAEAERASIAKEREALFLEALEQERQKRDEELRSIDWIDHVADAYDRKHYEENRIKALEAVRVCKEKIIAHNLDMKLVDAHYLLSEPKVLFFFTAENRVDFRALVKDLVTVFRMRIELRQIGVRDESRVLGGLGVCGRDYCCHGVTDHLKPVSIKMAKEQNLSLNSMKISGPCGRLLCCLAYEYDFYKEEKSRLPSAGSKLKIRNEMLKISEVNILSKMYHLTAFDGRMLMIPFEKVIFNENTGHWDVDQDYIEEVLSV